MYLPSTQILINDELFLIIDTIDFVIIDSLNNNFRNYILMSVVEIQYFHYDKWCQIVQSTNYVPVKFELRTVFCLQEHQQSGLTEDCEAMNLESSMTNQLLESGVDNLRWKHIPAWS